MQQDADRDRDRRDQDVRADGHVGTEFTTTGLINSNTVTSLTLTSSGAAATASSGASPYPIVPSTAIGTGLSGDYTIGCVNGTLTITPAGLTVTATDQTRSDTVRRIRR